MSLLSLYSLVLLDTFSSVSLQPVPHLCHVSPDYLSPCFIGSYSTSLSILASWFSLFLAGSSCLLPCYLPEFLLVVCLLPDLVLLERSVWAGSVGTKGGGMATCQVCVAPLGWQWATGALHGWSNPKI
ncbi:hypothetical protein ATANTOWER_023280 [Ataeniobius toweri]|uniref:Secreted protein n=1 Tax=Ataeniobius toweri TaxID=208326 RepID=A0ABU7A7R9_9TELE|nr:hypothetical protein [Ataeniobius toweri]